jgi:hypothetical protein
MKSGESRAQEGGTAAVEAFGRACPQYEDPGLALLGLLLRRFLEVHGPERMLEFCKGMAHAEEQRRRSSAEQLRRFELEHGGKGAKSAARRLGNKKEK